MPAFASIVPVKLSVPETDSGATLPLGELFALGSKLVPSAV